MKTSARFFALPDGFPSTCSRKHALYLQTRLKWRKFINSAEIFSEKRESDPGQKAGYEQATEKKDQAGSGQKRICA
ncbi:MAG: hypothetical protein SVS15_10370 [Thermodesulfobacteriota bacterium]|nr:hypothetical protein [Thermodesulfobacteriota bacterium]